MWSFYTDLVLCYICICDVFINDWACDGLRPVRFCRKILILPMTMRALEYMERNLARNKLHEESDRAGSRQELEAKSDILISIQLMWWTDFCGQEKTFLPGVC